MSFQVIQILKTVLRQITENYNFPKFSYSKAFLFRHLTSIATVSTSSFHLLLDLPDFLLPSNNINVLCPSNVLK
ncbi:hypothetical protein CEXT_738411 [Caerostris extrusa]|uniref:Uncharacterized protein n=1 Tax=Caerostris extrusa TaxID=172846 RepID=A0AAV4XLJ0_CAEEX|nr:hypothetical protein CEXT_738411 [Caerostris extrusa]